jgi:hypothetical protein
MLLQGYSGSFPMKNASGPLLGLNFANQTAKTPWQIALDRSSFKQ